MIINTRAALLTTTAATAALLAGCGPASHAAPRTTPHPSTSPAAHHVQQGSPGFKTRIGRIAWVATYCTPPKPRDLLACARLERVVGTPAGTPTSKPN